MLVTSLVTCVGQMASYPSTRICCMFATLVTTAHLGSCHKVFSWGWGLDCWQATAFSLPLLEVVFYEPWLNVWKMVAWSLSMRSAPITYSCRLYVEFGWSRPFFAPGKGDAPMIHFIKSPQWIDFPRELTVLTLCVRQMLEMHIPSKLPSFLKILYSQFEVEADIQRLI